MINPQVPEEEKGKNLSRFSTKLSQSNIKRGNHEFLKSTTHPNYKETQSTFVGYTIKVVHAPK